MRATQVLIVGGGPAGMMAGLLFARAGVPTTVIEKHGDFLRDFRGDTVHPSTLELFRELGLLDGLLARPYDMVTRLDAVIAGERVRIADFRQLPVESRFLALMPQWEFLDFVSDAARRYPAFALRMGCEATGVAMSGERVAGVRTASGEELRADLVIAADGWRSVLREAALPLEQLGAPIDVFWFRLPKPATSGENHTTGVFATGRLLALIDRGDYWQCAFVFAKGQANAIRARGIAAFREDVARTAPWLTDGVEAPGSFDDVKLLSVALDRLTRWSRPGLLAIGDAAYAMSPVGGVGINLAIQDAVAAANILAAPLAEGREVNALLPKVQARRMFPTRVVQRIQQAAHARIITPIVIQQAPLTRPPTVIRLLQRLPVLQRLPARIVGLGVRREHIRSPEAPGGLTEVVAMRGCRRRSWQRVSSRGLVLEGMTVPGNEAARATPARGSVLGGRPNPPPLRLPPSTIPCRDRARGRRRGRHD